VFFIECGGEGELSALKVLGGVVMRLCSMQSWLF